MATLGLPIVALIVTICILLMIGFLIILYKNYLTTYLEITQIELKKLRGCIPDFKLLDYDIVNYSIIMNITNLSCSIEYSKFMYVDLVIIYISENDTIIEWLKYCEDGGLGTWRVIAIYDDIINPINQLLKSGLWDAGETLTINATLTSLPDKIIQIIITTPEGYVKTLTLS